MSEAVTTERTGQPQAEPGSEGLALQEFLDFLHIAYDTTRKLEQE